MVDSTDRRNLEMCRNELLDLLGGFRRCSALCVNRALSRPRGMMIAYLTHATWRGAAADCGVLDGVCLLLYANKLDLEQQSPLDVNEVSNAGYAVLWYQ